MRPGPDPALAVMSSRHTDSASRAGAWAGGRSALAAAALALVAACGPTDAPEGAPNVLLVSLDSVRRDLVGSYGRRPRHAPDARTSPHLDRLAERGVLFENASATSSWTLPSHASLFTGLPELVHAVDMDGQRVSEDLPFLAEVLNRHGYATAGVYSGPYLDPSFGFGRGFDRYVPGWSADLERARRDAALRAERVDRDAGPAPTRQAVSDNAAALRQLQVASQADVSSERVTDVAIAELERMASGDVPFFLFAHYFDPHYDYVPPPPFDTRFDPTYDGDVDGRNFIRNERIATFDSDAESGRRRVIEARDLEHVAALYEGELASTDAQVGRLLERLAELGLERETLVVLVADHGDEFFEHGGLGHRRTLFEEVLAVPLVLCMPGRLPGGVRIPASVSLTDVFGTVLDVAGIEPPRRTLSESLLPSLDDPDQDRESLGRIVAQDETEETFEVEGRKYDVACHRIRVLETWRHGPLKLTRERRWLRAAQSLPPVLERMARERGEAQREEELLRWIDLDEHPDERAEDHSADFSDPRVRAALRAFHDRHLELRAARRAPEYDEQSEELLAALRGLGYVGAEAPIGLLSEDELVLPPPGSELLGD